MYGLINSSLQSMIRDKFGDEQWDKVLIASGVPEDSFLSMRSYDDAITYDLEGTLWMGFYELLTHIRTVQRLKVAQRLEPTVDLPRVGYLRLPEYWGDTEANGPTMDRLR